MGLVETQKKSNSQSNKKTVFKNSTKLILVEKQAYKTNTAIKHGAIAIRAAGPRHAHYFQGKYRAKKWFQREKICPSVNSNRIKCRWVVLSQSQSKHDSCGMHTISKTSTELTNYFIGKKFTVLLYRGVGYAEIRYEGVYCTAQNVIPVTVFWC